MRSDLGAKRSASLWRVRASRRSSVVVFASILPSRRMWATSLPRSARRRPTRRQRWQVRGSCSEHISAGRVRAAISSTLCEALGEDRARRHLLVIGDASFADAAAEFETKEHVPDAGGVEALLQRGPVEVRQPRRRVRSYVDDDADSGGVKQTPEGRPIMGRMSNTINCLQRLYLPSLIPL